MAFGNKIREYKEELLSDLRELIKIESVSSQHPDKCVEALQWMLKKAEDFGLIAKNIDNKAGHAQLGEGGKLCATLTHLDVVPASSNWDTDPFDLTLKDGRLLGRGVADDKGSALITLYCLRILKECGIEGKNTLRAIFGTDEEVGMTDVAAYFAKEDMPDMSFTPDAEYGICRAEKGILQLELTCNRGNAAVLTELKGGTVVNAVADSAYAVINCSENDDHQLMRLADAKNSEFDFMYTPDGMLIKCSGKAAHACEADKGNNAILQLIDLLASNFSLSALGNLCSFISTRLRLETDGTSLGMKMRDSQSGALTVCTSTIDINETTERATLDIRYPVTFGGKELIKRVKKAADVENIEVNVLSHAKPLYLDDTKPVIGILKDAYSEIMGEQPEMYATGGGTYARKLGGNGVAFGPVFSGDPSNLHTDNEGLDEENFMNHAEICLEAMYRMYIAD
ncbi:MAG: M20 family metallopeptidase [Ruminococcaceae bacterium]|nr:M20 family metallopeptidase [Oscillospiraceae bacterium]